MLNAGAGSLFETQVVSSFDYYLKLKYELWMKRGITLRVSTGTRKSVHILGSGSNAQADVCLGHRKGRWKLISSGLKGNVRRVETRVSLKYAAIKVEGGKLLMGISIPNHCIRWGHWGHWRRFPGTLLRRIFCRGLPREDWRSRKLRRRRLLLMELGFYHHFRLYIFLFLEYLYWRAVPHFVNHRFLLRLFTFSEIKRASGDQ